MLGLVIPIPVHMGVLGVLHDQRMYQDVENNLNAVGHPGEVYAVVDVVLLPAWQPMGAAVYGTHNCMWGAGAESDVSSPTCAHPRGFEGCLGLSY
jgi:hypothetical protein